MSNNAFIASAKKSQHQQAVIQKAQPEGKELVVISVRITKRMRQKLRQHYADTGETQTALINRLLEEELG